MMRTIVLNQNKKKSRTLLGMLLAVMCMMALTYTTACAENAQKIVDDYDLLTDGEEAELQELYANIAEAHGVDVVVVTTDSYEGKTPEQYTDDYYYDNNYGIGPDYDGILMTLSMGDRKFHMSTNGYAIQAFTDYGMQRIDDMISEKLTDGEYYEAFKKFGELCETFIEEAEKGTPFDTNHKFKENMSMGKRSLISAAVGLVLSLLTAFGLNIQLDRAKLATTAGAYIRPGSFQVTRSRDIFLYRNVTSKKIEKDNGGGSSTHDNGHGGSSGGHTGSF